jgi:hypothetical protein
MVFFKQYNQFAGINGKHMPTHQYSLTLIHREANGSVIDQRSVDGYINATAMCTAAGKKIGNYFQNQTTSAFLVELASDIGNPISEIVQVIKGGNPTEQGTWVHPQVAIHLAQWLSPTFSVKVSKWVYDWMSGKGAPAAPAALPAHLARYLANDGKVPPGYFSVLQETGLNLFGPLHNIGFEIPKGWVPDISVGRIFCAWLRDERGIDTDALPTYIHTYGDHRKPAAAKLYPDDLLADFRRWFRTVWLPENGVAYFKGKDPGSLAYLDRLPALAAPTKAAVLPRR